MGRIEFTKKDFLALIVTALFIVFLVKVGVQDGRFEPQPEQPTPVVTAETLALDTVTVADTVVVLPSCDELMGAADSAHDYLPSRKHHEPMHRGLDRLERMLHQYCSPKEAL